VRIALLLFDLEREGIGSSLLCARPTYVMDGYCYVPVFHCTGLEHVVEQEQKQHGGTG
jgi:hypothetical protein